MGRRPTPAHTRGAVPGKPVIPGRPKGRQGNPGAPALDEAGSPSLAEPVTDVPEEIRNGDWLYQAFTADGKPNEKANLAACFQCHKPLDKQDFVFS
jgi:hypothetical protein